MRPSAAYLTLIAVTAIWGGSWLAGRVVSLEGVAPLAASVGRFSFGLAGLLVFLLLTRQGLPWALARHHLPGLLAMGLTGVYLYNVCFFHGLRTIPASRASLLVALQPSVVMLYSVLFLRAPVVLRQWLGLGLSFFGVALVMTQGDAQRLLSQGLGTGDLWLLGCVVSWSSYTLISRAVLRHLPSLPATALSTGFGLLALLATWAADGGLSVGAAPGSLSLWPIWNRKVWLAVTFLGLAGTSVAFVGFLRALSAVGAPKATIFLNLTPVFGVLFSVLFLGEQLTLWTVLGGLLAIFGVWLLTTAAPAKGAMAAAANSSTREAERP